MFYVVAIMCVTDPTCNNTKRRPIELLANRIKSAVTLSMHQVQSHQSRLFGCWKRTRASLAYRENAFIMCRSLLAGSSILLRSRSRVIASTSSPCFFISAAMTRRCVSERGEGGFGPELDGRPSAARKSSSFSESSQLPLASSAHRSDLNVNSTHRRARPCVLSSANKSWS
jgi:hypothetical protein